MSQGQSSVMPSRSTLRGSKPPKRPKSKKRKSKLKVFFITLFFLLLGLLLAIAGWLSYLLLQTDEAFDTISIVDETVATPVPVKESVKKKPVSMVIMGIDSRSGGGGLNTDVLMVASFDPESKSASIVSIPRDTLIQVEGYRGRKANRFYADFFMAARNEGRSKEEAAIEAKEEFRSVLGKLFGIDIKYATVVNFKGFEDTVDLLGGIDVYVDMRMKYTDSHDGTNIDLQKGQQQLNGKQTLDFVRYRQSNDGTNMSSDFDRNRRQSEVVGALVDKLMTIGGVSKIGSIIEKMSENVQTDMPEKEISRMINTYLGIKSSNLTFMPLEGSWKSPYVYINEESLQKTRNELQAKMGMPVDAAE
ncbi:LCP family protein [Paenibacillus chungangensis]|uniref:LCP family protein n=1 Tax=Paenibacillus chungangensis TaxID=696535 RepID=A0ABW3HXV9_9BACL